MRRLPHARTIHERFDVTEPLQRGDQHLSDVVFVRDVGGDRDGRRAFTRKLPQNFFRFADR